MGNSAFHSNALYPSLPYAISFLVSALSDSDDKTRANAAGGLGNLVRNGGEMSEALVQAGGPQALLMMSIHDPSVFAKVRYYYVHVMYNCVLFISNIMEWHYLYVCKKNT